jgi:hypothetical protein
LWKLLWLLTIMVATAAAISYLFRITFACAGVLWMMLWLFTIMVATAAAFFFLI